MGGPPVGPPVILPIQDRNILRFQAHTVESLPVLTACIMKKGKRTILQDVVIVLQ